MNLNFKILSKLILFIFLNTSLIIVKGQYSELNKIVKLINSNDPDKKDKSDYYLNILREKDETQVIYNYALTLKLYKIDNNLKDAYNSINICVNLFNETSIKEQRKIYKKVFDIVDNPDKLKKNIEYDGYVIAHKENTLNSFRNYLNVYNDENNIYYLKCGYSIDSIMFSIAKNNHTLYSYRNYLKTSIYQIYKKESIEQINIIEKAIAENSLKTKSSATVKSSLDSITIQSAWFDSLINHYYECRWNEINTQPNIAEYSNLINEIDKNINQFRFRKNIDYIKQKCINHRDKLIWHNAEIENNLTTYFNYLQNPVTSIYKDTAIEKLITLISLNSNYELIEQVLPFCNGYYKNILNLLHDSLILESYVYGGQEENLEYLNSDVLTRLRTGQFKSKFLNIYSKEVIEQLEMNFTFEDYYRLMTNFKGILDSNTNLFKLDSSNLYKAQKMFELCYPYDSTIQINKNLPINYTKDDLECPIGFNFSPVIYGEGSTCGGYVTRSLGYDGFCLMIGNNIIGTYSKIKFKKSLGHNFFIFSNLNVSNYSYFGEPIGEDFIVFFNPLANSPFKFVCSINLKYDEDFEIFKPANYLRKIKQTLIKYKKTTSYNPRYGLFSIDFKYEILPVEYTEFSEIKLTYRNKQDLFLKLEVDEQIGLSTIEGNILIKPVFTNLKLNDNAFTDGVQIIEYKDKYGLMNHNYEIILDAVYDEIKYLYTNKIYAIRENITNTRSSYWQIFNPRDKKILPPRYGRIDAVGKYFLVSNTIDGSQYFMDNNYKPIYVIPNNFKIRDCMMGQNDMITVIGWINRKNTWALINLQAKKLIIFSAIHPMSSLSAFSHDRILFKDVNGKYGYLDQNGLITIKPIYDDANDFYGEYTHVSLYGEYFKINKYGKKIN